MGYAPAKSRLPGMGKTLAAGCAIVLGMLLVAGAAYADPVLIMGKIVSSETGEPLPFANLVLTRLESPQDTLGTPAGGAMSMPDGTYRLDADPGLYRLLVSYISYHPKRITDLEVEAGEPVTLNIPLTPTTLQIETVEVTAKAIQNTEVALLARQKKSAAVSDGVSSEQISKSSDSNAADVVARITGLSVVDGRYVFVRGLGERYSSTQVNGATVGTPEANKKVVPLDLFAAGLLDNVVIQKTYTPDQPGEFGGGVVQVNTRDFPGQRIWDFSLSSGYNQLTTGKDFYSYKGGDLDFMGIDDGARELPGIIKDAASHKMIFKRSFVDSLQGKPGFDSSDITEMGRAFNKTWGRSRETGKPAYSFSGSYGDEVNLLGRTLGFLGSLSFSNSSRTWEGDERFFQSDQGVLDARTDYHFNTSEVSTLWGAIGNLAYRLNDFNTLAIRTMYNRSSEDQLRFYSGENDDTGAPLSNTRLLFIERGLFSSTMGTSHFLAPLNGSTLDLKFNYSRANRNEPDRREYSYELRTLTDYVYDPEDREVVLDTLQTDVWMLSTRSISLGFTRMFGAMVEEDRGPEAHLTVPFRHWNGLESKFKAGASYRNRNRNATWRRLAFAAPTDFRGVDRDSLLAMGPEDLMTDDWIGGTPRTFQLKELTRPERDNYTADSDITAGYFMFDMPFSSKLRTVFGARVERADITVRPYDPFGLTPQETLDSSTAHLDDTDILPSLNLTLTPRENLNARAAYSMTIARPDLRELSPFGLTDFQSSFETMGNPELKRSQIHNVDLRVESFPSMNELVAASVFYKKLIDPIEQSIRMAQNPVYQPINGEGGQLYGAEVETRFNLDRVTSKAANFAASANLTLVESETRLEKIGDDGESDRPLQGQSPYVLNLGLYFASNSGRTGAALLYNVFGRRLSGIGVAELPDIYEEPRHSVDFTLSHRLGGAKLKLAVENVLDDDVEFVQKQEAIDGVTEAKDVVTRRYERGRGIAFSVSTGS